jgi:cell division septation protein DedD
MAEEKVDGLEGLDDFGDDFGEQLDSFMENDGEEESDSELDSFFEDLSTIDDLEGDDDSETAEDKKEEEKTDEVKSDDEGDGDVDEDDGDEDNEEVEDDYDTELEDESDGKGDDTSTAKQKKKKGLLKPLIISSITGLLLGVITVVVLYFFATPAETTLFETVIEIPTEPVPPVKVSKPEPKKPKKAKVKVKAKAKATSYYVQVVSCISHECVNESRLQLKTLGYKSRVRSSNESSGISEVLSTKFFGEEFSARMVKKINNNNPLAGHAFRKSMGNGYQVSLGLFPDLETANRVRTYLNQAFKKDIFFKIQRTTQKIRFQAVQIAGFKSKKDAVKLRDKLRKNNTNFQSAFVKADLKP